MSLIRLFLNPLNPKSQEKHEVEPGTQLIDFLQNHFPNGFDGVLRVFVNLEEIDLENLDYEIQEEEQVIMLVMPAGVETVIGYIVTAVISVAIGYVINLLFPPSSPAALKDEPESSVYSINTSRNSARVNEPIPVVYGTVSYPPDFASAPYVFFLEESNDQFADHLLCLGQGKFDVTDIYIGDTPVGDIETGAVRYWLFSQEEHGQQLGNIEQLIWNEVKYTEAPWPFRENVFTSPEVESWEFNNDRSDIVGSWTAFSGSAFSSEYDPVAKSFIPGRVEGVDSSLVIKAGDTLSLQGTVLNNGDFLIGSAVVDSSNPLLMTLFESWTTDPGFSQFADEDPLPGGTQYQLNTNTNNMIAGPFRCQKVGQEVDSIDCDIVFPQGLYRVDGTSGNIKTLTVEMQFTYQQIDENGDPVVAAITQNRTWTSKSRSPLRATVQSGDLPPGTYECSVERVTPIDDDSRKHDIVSWAGLRGNVVLDTTQTVYGKTTLLAVRMKATNGLGTASRSRIRVTARRILDTGESENPITIIKDIWTNSDYGLGQPLNDLYLDEINPLEEDWAEEDGPRFNGAFDKRGTGLDGMQNVVSLAGARVVQNGGLTTVVPDRIQDVRTAMFSSANIVRDSMEIGYTFDTDGEFDGISIEYRDPITFDPAYALYPETSTTPDTYILFGCTDQTYAEQFAVYLQNNKRRRRKIVRFQTELEGLIPKFGDRIAVSTPLADWGQSGVVVEVIDPQTIMVDQPLDWIAGDTMMLRDQNGAPSLRYSVSKGSNDNVAVFDEAPTELITNAEGQEPTSYAFGTLIGLIRDFMVTKVSPKSDTIVEIEAQVYASQIYEGAPPHMSPPLGPCSVSFPQGPITAELLLTSNNTRSALNNQNGTEQSLLSIDGNNMIAFMGWDAVEGKSEIHISGDSGVTWSLIDSYDVPGIGQQPSQYYTHNVVRSDGSGWWVYAYWEDNRLAMRYFRPYSVGSTWSAAKPWPILSDFVANDSTYAFGWKGFELDGTTGNFIHQTRFLWNENATVNDYNWLGIAKRDLESGDFIPGYVEGTASWTSQAAASDSGELRDMTTHWLAVFFDGSYRARWHEKGDLSQYTQTTVNDYLNGQWFDTNGTNVALMVGSAAQLLRWTAPGINDPLPVIPLSDSASLQTRTAYKKLYSNTSVWLAIGYNGTTTAQLWQSTDEGATFTSANPQGWVDLQLPSEVDSNASFTTLIPGPDNYWYGMYRDETTKLAKLYRFQYETYSGDCT